MDELGRYSFDLARHARKEGRVALGKWLGVHGHPQLPRVREPFLTRYEWGLPFLFVAAWAEARGGRFVALWPSGSPALRLEYLLTLESAAQVHSSFRQLSRELGRVARMAGGLADKTRRNAIWLLYSDVFGLSDDEIAQSPHIGLWSPKTVSRGITGARRVLKGLRPPWRVLVLES